MLNGTTRPCTQDVHPEIGNFPRKSDAEEACRLYGQGLTQNEVAKIFFKISTGIVYYNH